MSAASLRPSDDEDPTARPGETPAERADRNWTEILQELRVSQTGTQIVAGFLLAAAFQPRFASLDALQHVTYGVLVGIATIATALGIGVVALHRSTFRRHEKAVTVRFGSVLLSLDVAAVALLAVGVAFFVFDVAFGRATGVVAGVAATVLVAVLTLLLPGRARVVGLRGPRY